MQVRENKCHLRLANCLSRSLQQHWWDVSPGCVKRIVTSLREEVTGTACTWPTSELPKLAGMIQGLLWLVLVLVVLECMMKPQTQYDFPASCARTSVIFSPVFDLLHSNTPLFLKETWMERSAEWSACTGLWFRPFDACIYERRSCARRLRARVCASVHYIRLMNAEQMALKW